MEGGILIYRFVVEKFLIRMRGVSSLEYAVQKIYMQQRESFEVSSRSICNGVVRDEER